MTPAWEIREARESDVQALLDLHLALDRETSFMLVEPGERETDVSVHRDRLRRTLEQPNQTVLVADAEERLVGFLAVLGGPYRRNRHNAYLVLGVLQEFAGRGVGAALMDAGIRWAAAAGIQRLELTVMAHNDRAIRLYERKGFEREGIRSRALRVDGEWVDELYMALLLPSREAP